jgi:hypothetical protein
VILRSSPVCFCNSPSARNTASLALERACSWSAARFEERKVIELSDNSPIATTVRSTINTTVTTNAKPNLACFRSVPCKRAIQLVLLPAGGSRVMPGKDLLESAFMIVRGVKAVMGSACLS